MTNNLTLIGFGALWLLAAAALVAFRARRGSGTHTYKPVALMTANELDFFQRLRRAVPDCHVFPQVSMAAIIQPAARDPKTRLQAFRRISQKRVDWAIYSPQMELLCIVELDDRTHDAKRDAARDANLQTAGIRTLRWHSTRKPNDIEIRTQIDVIRDARRAQARAAASGSQNDKDRGSIRWEIAR
jgi:very-short-patch-repair endonuclease